MARPKKSTACLVDVGAVAAFAGSLRVEEGARASGSGSDEEEGKDGRDARFVGVEDLGRALGAGLAAVATTKKLLVDL